MADREVDIQVRADGVEDAAEQAQDSSVNVSNQGGGQGGSGGGGMLGQSLKGGAILAALNLVLNVLGPIRDYLSATLEILSAFFAPVAVLLLRLFMPVLRLMIKILPYWYSFMGAVDGYLQDTLSWIANLPGAIWSFLVALPGLIWSKTQQGYDWITGAVGDIASETWNLTKQGFNWLLGGLRDLPRDIWDFLKDLPEMIGESIAEYIPGADSVSEAAGNAGDSLRERGSDVRSRASNMSVNLSGGLDTFVDRVERSSDVDL